MEKLHDLKERICSFDNLYEAYVSAAKGKADREEVLRFAFHLEENLYALQDALLHRTYRVGPYREFYVRYPKPGLVMALRFPDRVVQWAIYRQIDPFIDKRFITHSYGCRRNKGTLAAAETLMNWMRIISRKPDAKEYCIIKGDISKFFYRVDHEIIMQCYREISDDEWFLWLMDVIINNPDVPFGLPDQWCKHELKLRKYERYMDDFAAIVKGQAEAERIFRQMSDYLQRELRLRMSAKARILPATRETEFVGFTVSAHGLRLRKKTIRHVQRSLKHVAELYAEGEIPLEKALETIRCYWGLPAHVNGFYLRKWIEANITLQRKGGVE